MVGQSPHTTHRHTSLPPHQKLSSGHLLGDIGWLDGGLPPFLEARLGAPIHHHNWLPFTWERSTLSVILFLPSLSLTPPSYSPSPPSLSFSSLSVPSSSFPLSPTISFIFPPSLHSPSSLPSLSFLPLLPLTYFHIPPLPSSSSVSSPSSSSNPVGESTCSSA